MSEERYSPVSEFRHTHTGDLPHIVRLRMALEDCNNRMEVLIGKLKVIARELEAMEETR